MSSKTTIWLQQTCRPGPDPTKPEYAYVVERVQNSTKWKVGDVLKQAAVTDLCGFEDPTVNIK